MILVDLSRDIEHRMPGYPGHPAVVITKFGLHDEIRHADG